MRILAIVLLVVIIGGYLALRRPDIPIDTLRQTYANEASRFADLPGGVRMHYRDQGSRTGATVLLIHGYSASLNTWEPWVERLGERYRLVTIDLPGHGLTSAPGEYAATIERYVADVEAFVQAAKLGRFTIAGSSMGGNVAWEYALAHPRRVEGLVLIAASGWPNPQMEESDDTVLWRLLRTPVIGPLLRELDSTPVVQDGLRNAFDDPAVVDDAMVRRYVELGRGPGHRAILIAMADRESRRDATKALLAGIRVPTLVLHGERDHLVPVEHASLFGAAIAGAEVVTWPDEGHIPMEEHPDRSAEAVARFLERVDAARSIGPEARPFLAASAGATG